MESTLQVIIGVLLAVLSFCGGFMLAAAKSGQRLGKTETKIAVHDTLLHELKEKEDHCIRLHEETLGLVKEVVCQNSIVIQQIIPNVRPPIGAR